MVSEGSARIRIGAADGFALRKIGACGRSAGRSAAAALSAACTAGAAPSILRARSNCTVMPVELNVLVEVISVTPAISPNRRSSGAATVDAIVAGSAPGRDATMLMVDRSNTGRLATI